MLLQKEREDVVNFSQKMIVRGLTKGTGGNISIFNKEQLLFAITPSAMEYDVMTPADVVVMRTDGTVVEGSYAPSSEWQMHAESYKKRPDITAVVHTHSTFCTTLACMMEPILPVHYLLGYAGGTVDCIPYYLFGSQELADHATDALRERNAVLLGHHGLLCVGKDINFAFNAAEETEFVAEIYYRARNSASVKVLSDEDMTRVLARFSTYGNTTKKV